MATQETRRSSVLVVTRIHMRESSVVPVVDSMVQFVLNASTYASKILICVGSGNTSMPLYLESLKTEINLLSIPESTVEYLCIDPWGHFTYSLNAAVTYAQDQGYNRICFQSVEYRIGVSQFNTLMEIVNRDENTLVVGPVMEGHDFTAVTENTVPSDSPPSIVAVRGRTVPWNTCAVWNVDLLGVTGFPLLGDGVAGRRDIGGVEEVSAINLLQLINPQIKAILVKFIHPIQSQSAIPNASVSVHLKSALKSPLAAHHASATTAASEWSTEFTQDAERQRYHDRKMASKDDRPARQMEVSRIPAGTVCHVAVVQQI